MFLLTCEGSSSVPEVPSPKWRMSWLFPVNQSIFTLPDKLLKSCCSLVLVFVSPVLLEYCPKVSHTGSSCLCSDDMWAFIKDKVVGAFHWLPGRVFIFSSECGVCFSPSASRKPVVCPDRVVRTVLECGQRMHWRGQFRLHFSMPASPLRVYCNDAKLGSADDSPYLHYYVQCKGNKDGL